MKPFAQQDDRFRGVSDYFTLSDVYSIRVERWYELLSPPGAGSYARNLSGEYS
jgi:hypothetical protein